MNRCWIVLFLLITLLTGCANDNPNTSDVSNPNKNISVSEDTSNENQTLQSENASESITMQAIDIKNYDKSLDDIGFAIMEDEALGELKYGLEDKEIIRIIGAAESTSEATVWGADEMEHQTWIYKSKGIELDMIRNGENQKVDMITVRYPCDLKTKENIGIGSSKEEVINAYNDLINQEESNVDQGIIVVGSVYGGVLFSMENNVVSEIFIGASAD